MTLLNWLPEIYLLILLFSTLVVMNFGVLSYRSLSVGIASFASVGLIYYVFRDDLAYFESPLKILLSDSLSHFGKILSLITLIVFSLGFHFHRGLSFQSKQSSNLFLLFYSFFTIVLFQANSLVLFLGAALGIYLCGMNLVLIESNKEQRWVALFRQRTLPVGLWGILISFIFVLGCNYFGSVYISDWITQVPKFSGSPASLFVFAFLVLLASTLPFGGLRYRGKAPLGISIICYSLFLVLSSFWLRFGIPFFSLSTLLSKNMAQMLLSLMIGGFTLRYAWHTIRTRDHQHWYSSALPASVGLSLFLIVLPGEQALPAFYCISLSLLFTFALISHAFLTEDYKHKTLLVVGVASLVGMSPLILGEQYYRLVRDAVASGNITAGVLMVVAWFGLTIAVTQKISKVLLVRNPLKARRKMFFSEMFFLAIYFLCVISLTVFRPGFVALLNERPAANLW
jgi:hypothetical protein